MKTTLFAFALAAILAAPLPALAAAKGQPLTIPDLTKGDAIPAGAKHDWNLGATGARGWRQVLSNGANLPDAGLALLDQALAQVTAAPTDR